MIAFLNISLMQPSSLIIGHFKIEAVNNGDIPRITITTPMKIDGFEDIMYEPNEYSYDNDDSISK